MHHQKKLAVLMLGIIHLLLTLATTVMAEPISQPGQTTTDIQRRAQMNQPMELAATSPTPVQPSYTHTPPQGADVVASAAPMASTQAPVKQSAAVAPAKSAPVIAKTPASAVRTTPPPAAAAQHRAENPVTRPAQTSKPAVQPAPARRPAVAPRAMTPARRTAPVRPVQAQIAPLPAPILAPRPIAPVQNQGLISRVLTATRGLVGRAVSWLGTRYVWGGSSKRGVDCSGLTRLLYKTMGINLPHSAKLQYKGGKAVAKAALLPGDLVFFNTRGPISHVGMYVGNRKFVHAANPKRGVRMDNLDSKYYAKRFAGARRYKSLS